jgi:ABC-type glycerol-3-phosphate transport system substrate-binding protein
MQGEYPMLYMGDWMIGDMDGEIKDADGNGTGEYKPVAGKIVGINFPAVGGSYDKQILGGSTDGFMVSAKSQNPEAAVEFVKWMTARLPEKSYQIGGAIPTRTNFDMGQYSADLPALSVSVAEFASKADGATLAWDTFLPKEPTARMLSMFQELVGQKISAEDFAKNMAKAMEEGGFTSY